MSSEPRQHEKARTSLPGSFTLAKLLLALRKYLLASWIR